MTLTGTLRSAHGHSSRPTIRLQHGETGIVLTNKKPALPQRQKGHCRVVRLSTLCRYCAPWAVSGVVPSKDGPVAQRVGVPTTGKKRFSIYGPGDGKQRSIIEAVNVRSRHL